MHGMKKTTRTTKRKWERYALPKGFAEHGYLQLPHDQQKYDGSQEPMMRTSHLLIHPLHLQRNTYKDLSLELVPSNLAIRYFCFLELFLTYMRI
jgi:hypothetical protein